MESGDFYTWICESCGTSNTNPRVTSEQRGAVMCALCGRKKVITARDTADRALERWRVLDDAIEIARGLCDPWHPDDADAQGEIEGLQRARGEVEGAGLSADGRVAVRRVLARALGGLAAGQAGVYFSRAHEAGATGHEEWEDEYRRRHREWTRVANAVRGIR